MPEAKNVLEAEKARLISTLRAHSFLTRCREGSVSLQELKFFLVQQGQYSAYFTRYLCAMMANLPSNVEVFELAENLFEELGFAGGEETPHYLLYRNMLADFGLSLPIAVLKVSVDLIELAQLQCSVQWQLAGSLDGERQLTHLALGGAA